MICSFARVYFRKYTCHSGYQDEINKVVGGLKAIKGKSRSRCMSLDDKGLPFSQEEAAILNY